MAKLGSAEWWQAHADLLNEHEQYRKAARGLNSVFEYHVGEFKTLATFKDGEITDVHEAADGEEGIMVIEAPLQVWTDVVDGKINPKVALVSGKIKLVKGSIAALARYMPAAGVIFGSMAEIPTD